MAKGQNNIEDTTKAESVVESLDKKIIVFHSGEEYLCINKDNGVVLKGENLKDSDGKLITDYKHIFKDFCFDLFTQYFENITILSVSIKYVLQHPPK